MTDEPLEEIMPESSSAKDAENEAHSGEPPSGQIEQPKRGKFIRGAQNTDRDVDFSKTPAEAIEEELEAAKKEASENYDKYLRALAELENFKKRTTKERSDLIKYQGERIFIDILDIADDIERALQFANADPGQLKAGLEMIQKRFMGILGKWEVRGESSIGKDFNPEYHNAISKIQSPDVEAGKVVGELKKMFFYKDKVLRHGEVVVAEALAEAVANAVQAGEPKKGQ